MFGLGDEDVRGLPLAQLLPQRYRIKHREYVASFRHSVVNSRPMQSRVAVRGLRKDGSEFPAEVTISKIHVGDKVEMTAVIRDISERASLIEELSLAATKDSLTGLNNRRHLETTLNRELQRSKRFGHVLGIILFDLDRFKSVNDLHGHICGDVVLRKIAEVVSREVREVDIFGRWGGEEFLLVLPETGEHSCAEWAERIRQLIENLRIDGCNQPIQITASFGIVETRGEELDVEALFKRVDKALYNAKREGRNRIVSERNISHKLE